MHISRGSVAEKSYKAVFEESLFSFQVGVVLGWRTGVDGNRDLLLVKTKNNISPVAVARIDSSIQAVRVKEGSGR